MKRPEGAAQQEGAMETLVRPRKNQQDRSDYTTHSQVISRLLAHCVSSLEKFCLLKSIIQHWTSMAVSLHGMEVAPLPLCRFSFIFRNLINFIVIAFLDSGFLENIYVH